MSTGRAALTHCLRTARLSDDDWTAASWDHLSDAIPFQCSRCQASFLAHEIPLSLWAKDRHIGRFCEPCAATIGRTARPSDDDPVKQGKLDV